MISQYRIADIDIVVDAPASLHDGEGFRLYRVPEIETAGERFDIRVIPDGDGMPQVNGAVVFEDVMHRVIMTDKGVFHQFRIPMTPYISAWNWIHEDRLCEIHVAPPAMPYYLDSIGCFNVVGFERILHSFGKYLFHCSYVDIGGRAILFSAPSGGGKTTQAQLWEKYGHAEMINGDRGVLEMTEQGVIVHGLPIAGSSGVFTNRTLPVAAIFVVRKAPINQATRMPHESAFQAILSELTLNTWNQEFVLGAVDFAMQIASQVPVYTLECTISEDAVRAAHTVL